MAGFGKWIGGGLGWVFGGPIGGILGFALGAVIDNVEVKKISTNNMPTTAGDFMISLLVLMAAVMKADGKIMKSELDFVKTYLLRNFDEDDAAEALKILKEILEKPIPLADVCNQIREHVNYSSRLQLIHLLYGIALADKSISREEMQTIEEICGRLGIHLADQRSIKSMFIEETDWAYKVLEIEKSATDEEIKKAYRKMAVKYHPDKVAYLGEEIRKTANEKFQKVNEAYEKIKKERNLV
jgi:DnaJ like chaperone protein